MKYAKTDIVFQEVPNEVTLAVNISNCPCHCPGCHSQYLWADEGEELDENTIDAFVGEYGDSITCVCFMGGDVEPKTVDRLAAYIKKVHSGYKVGWYTGRTIISSAIDTKNFDYIKVGPYIQHLGPLKERKTNQRMYRVDHEKGTMEDITSLFWSDKH